MSDENYARMCKKIAQLTKVIFELNTRNDERDMSKNYMQNHYEKEIEAMVSEANNRLYKLKEALERYQDNELKYKLENTLVEIEGDKNMARNQFESMRNTYERREAELIETYEHKIATMSNSLDNLKSEVETALTQSSSGGGSSGGFSTDDINTIKKTIRMEFEARIETLQEESAHNLNRKEEEIGGLHSQILDLKKAELLQLDDSRRLQKALDEASSKGKDAESKLMERVKELNDQMVSKDQTNLRLTNEMQVLQKKLNEYSSQLLSMEEHLEDYKGKTEIITQGSSELQNMLLEKDAHIKKLLTETKALKEEKKTIQFSLDQSDAQKESLNGKIAELQSELDNYRDSLQSTDQQLNQTVEEYKTTIDILKDQIKTQSQSEETLKAQIDLYKNNLRTLQAENDQLKQSKNSSSKSIDEMAATLESYKQELELKEGIIVERNGKIKSLEAEAEAMHKALNEVMAKNNELKDGSSSAINNYIEENSMLKTAKSLLDEQLKEKDQTIATLNQSIDALKETNKNQKKQLDQLQNDFSACKTQLTLLETQMHVKEGEINELQGLNSYKDKCIELSNQIEEFEMQIHSLKSQIDDHVAEIEKLRHQLKDTSSKYEHDKEKEKELKDMQKKLQDEMDLLRNQHEDAIRKLKEEFNLKSRNSEGDLETRLRAEFEHELEKRLLKLQKEKDYEVEQLQVEHDGKIKRVSNEFQIKMSDLQIEIDQLRQSNKKLQSDYDMKMNDKKATEGDLVDKISELNRRISELMREHEAKMSELSAKHLTEISKVEDRYKEMIANVEKVGDEKIAHLKHINEKDIKEKIEFYDNKIDKIQNDHKEHIKQNTEEMNSKYESYIREITSSKDQKIEQKDAEISRLNSSLTSKQNENANLAEIIKHEKEMKESSIATLKANLTHMEDEVKRTLARAAEMEKEFAEREEHLKLKQQRIELTLQEAKDDMDKKYKKDCENLLGSHRWEVQELRKEFDKILKDLRNENETVQERYVDLQEIYDSRPSKQEDLELIQLLQTKMGEVDDIIRRKDEELKYFKLELINRENSYNKIFKNNVLVGNINPLDYKTNFKGGVANPKDPNAKPNKSNVPMGLSSKQNISTRK